MNRGRHQSISCNSLDSSRSGCIAALLIALFAACGCNKVEMQTPVSRPTESLPVVNHDAGLEFLDGRTLDLGTGWENAHVKCSFRIRNASDQVVMFRKAVTTTCGCSAGELTSPRLQPGETTTLTVSLTLPATAGERKRYSATVHRELADGSLSNIPFIADIVTKAAWYTVPETLNVRLADSESRMINLNVFGSNGRTTNIVRVTSTVPHATVKYSSQKLDPHESVTVDCALPAEVTDGTYSLVIETDDELLPQRRIRLQIHREAAFDVMPKSVLLRRYDTDYRYVGRITVVAPETAGAIRCVGPGGMRCNVGSDREFERGRKMSPVDLEFEGMPSEFSGEDLVVSATTADGNVMEYRVPIRIAN